MNVLRQPGQVALFLGFHKEQTSCYQKGLSTACKGTSAWEFIEKVRCFIFVCRMGSLPSEIKKGWEINRYQYNEGDDEA